MSGSKQIQCDLRERTERVPLFRVDGPVEDFPLCRFLKNCRS